MKLLAVKVFSTSLLVATLGACGGGGGDGGLSLSDSFAVGQAYVNLLAANKSWTTLGSGSDGRAYTFTLATQRLADGTFAVDGKSYARVRQTLTLSASGTSPVSTPSVTDTYFNAATTLAAGSYSPDDGTCSKVSTASALPTSAGAGASGALSVDTELAACTSTAGTATNGSTTTTNWSLSAVSAASGSVFALLCQNSSIAGRGTSPSGTAAFCVEINANGTLGDRAQLSISIPSLPFSLTARNY